MVSTILIIAIAHGFEAKYIGNNSTYLLEIFAIYTPILFLIFSAFLFRTLSEWMKGKLIKSELEKEKLKRL